MVQAAGGPGVWVARSRLYASYPAVKPSSAASTSTGSVSVW